MAKRSLPKRLLRNPKSQNDKGQSIMAKAKKKSAVGRLVSKAKKMVMPSRKKSAKKTSKTKKSKR